LRAPSGDPVPPAAVVDLDDRVQQLWMSRVAQTAHDVYAGAPLCKLPEDLRIYEHLLWAAAPRVVIEVGAYGGGSALWFRDRLRALVTYGRVRDPLVIAVELEPSRTAESLDAADPDWRSSITLVAGDVRDPATIDAVTALVPAGAAALVVEDSAHEYDTTLASLEQLSRFVPAGGFFVVEDGCVDVEALRLEPQWPRGVLPAIRDWLATDGGAPFVVRRDLELYGLTCNPEGILQRRADG
jgi:cephalosporin hydroxylase